ncbi:uncharacterized protein Z520_09113 [Fonsecaea multimorphosa CBS 102226]|uniref:GPI anchored protein n=1 Tax=Fonsecaea multimorphosa CBS 102226 TaxID=1442371 RepID=A0A0D2JPA9_9EURO|nr:uncharacterized protein Z520_09113 [Fonsecaea multimorphosa CBS 102226]KIX95197.1 hypothetical protein Z520_09113 [Fonsecaea multimorphosa CBS 102226]OAL20913.1 hypothetical protein AYO22_08541 [Fonsecaea multimorphosa]
MAPWLQLAALPSSLLVLIASSIPPVTPQDLNLQWPYNLPADSKYYPEDEVMIKRDLDAQRKLQKSDPTGVRKMSGDPGEKFYLQYWGFEEQEEEYDGCSLDWANTTTLFTSFDQPVRVHDSYQSPPRLFRRLLPGWHLFAERDFQCPTGTSACTSIDRPNSCCATGYTCQLVQDTGNGLGDVACCPDGEVCGNTLSTSCASGQTSCPNNPGGGCCLAGYACYDVGCVQTSTATVLTNPATPSTTTVTSYTTVTPSPSTPTPTTHTSTTITTSPTSSTRTTSSVTPLPPVISTVTLTVTVTSATTLPLTCSSGFRSCPASLGGGCCPTDRQCGSSNCPALSSTTSSSSSSSATPEPPVRPTSLTTTVETTTTTATHSTSPSYPVTGCPTGFYACSAYYPGGCCQIGRNCDSTSCPAVSSTTLVSGNTLTIVAPTGSGITAPGTQLTGNCAHGWSTCAPSVGGGCCPSGYVCGATSCAVPASVTGGGGKGVGKEAPNAAAASQRKQQHFWVGVYWVVSMGVWLLVF